MSLFRPLADRFWEKVDKDGPNGCWLWTASAQQGYGVIGVDAYNTDLAHRVSWRLSRGTIPAGFGVLHRCDTPSCVNPDHLFLGSQKDNMLDCASKDRTVFGSRAKHAKLTEDKVREMRSLYGTFSCPELAVKFGVSLVTAWQAINRKTWKRVT